MSLINEALKRANQMPFRETAPNGPALRPVEGGRRPEGGVGLLLPVMLAVVVTLAVLLLWQGFRASYVVEVRARSVPATSDVAASDSHAASVPPALVAVAMASPAPVPMAAAPATPAAPVPASAMPVFAVATNAAVVVDPPPQPPSYKLQAIFYRPESPAAVINGKQLFVGDRVGEAYVVSIDPDSVAIVNASGQTNLLEMP
jgi:hypothetical protein